MNKQIFDALTKFILDKKLNNTNFSETSINLFNEFNNIYYDNKNLSIKEVKIQLEFIQNLLDIDIKLLNELVDQI